MGAPSWFSCACNFLHMSSAKGLERCDALGLQLHCNTLTLVNMLRTRHNQRCKAAARKNLLFLLVIPQQSKT